MGILSGSNALPIGSCLVIYVKWTVTTLDKKALVDRNACLECEFDNDVVIDVGWNVNLYGEICNDLIQ